MTSTVFFLTLLCLALEFSVVDSLKILLFAPGASRSHVLFNYRLASTLASRGHSVTIHNSIMSPDAITDLNTPAGIKEIRIMPASLASNSQNDNTRQLLAKTAFDKNPDKALLKQAFHMLFFLNNSTVGSCEEQLRNDTLLDELRNEHYDIALAQYLTLCPLAIGRIIGIEKFLWVSPGTYIIDSVAITMRIPTNPSYIPNILAHFTDRMTFIQRLANTVIHAAFGALMFTRSHLNQDEAAFRAKLADNGANTKSLRQFARDNVLALLINGEELLDYPRPFVPGMIFLGQMESTTSRAKTNLSQEWQSRGTEGIILFSLGTVLNTSLIPMEIKTAFFEAFKQFKSYTIIWRLEGEIPAKIEQQKHIKVVKWLPQRELLSSGLVKLFITHAGYNSLVETAKAGVPMLLLPLFGDQAANAKRAARHGIGLELDKSRLDADSIAQKIRTALDESHARKSAKFASVLKDKLLANEEAAVRQLERMGKARRWPLSPARNMHYIQLLCLDIICVALVAAASVLWVTVRALRVMVHFLSKS